jgi:cysteine sulfinate desulfinase/cysteine desulfurase-like protein
MFRYNDDSMSTQAIYLDHNATTPLDPRVAQAMQHGAGAAGRFFG